MHRRRRSGCYSCKCWAQTATLHTGARELPVPNSHCSAHDDDVQFLNAVVHIEPVRVDCNRLAGADGVARSAAQVQVAEMLDKP